MTMKVLPTYSKIHRPQAQFALFIFIISAYLVLSINLAAHIFSTPISGWPLSDYLINYSAGFVRRGLLGEVISYCNAPSECADKLNFLLFFAFITLSVAMFAVSAAKPWKTLAILNLIFASGALLDISRTEFNVNFWGRKEFLFYFFLVVIALAARLLSSKWFFLVALSCTVFSTLTHELFFVFFAPMLTIAINTKATEKNEGLTLAYGYLAISCALFLVTFFNNGSEDIAVQIAHDVQSIEPNAPLGAIAALGWTFGQSFALSNRLMEVGQIEYWIFHWAVAATSVGILLYVWATETKRSKIALALFTWMSIAIGVAAMSGWDWGRWISLFSIGSVLCIFIFDACLCDRPLTGTAVAAASHPNARMPYIACFTLLGLQALTDVEHCCTQGSKIEVSFFGPSENWFVLDDMVMQHLRPTASLESEAVESAIRSLELLRQSQATNNPAQLSQLRAQALQQLQRSLQKLSEAAAAGLQGTRGEEVAAHVEGAILAFRTAGLIE